jgi:hypothetical protein
VGVRIWTYGNYRRGKVNPEGAETKYYFEYGATESYGSKTAEASTGSGTGNVEVSKTIASLASNTKYHYRLVATNSNGTTDGADQVFATTHWSVQEPPAPTGAKRSYLNAVSCTSSTACTAVGSFENSAEEYVPLAEKWNGTAWSAQEPPAPKGTKSSALDDVSCTSSTACMAVGEFTNSSEKSVPFAEKWNGTAWSVQEPPTPKGAEISYLDGVSCTSATECIAIGFSWIGSNLPFADKWNGTTWSLQELPTPKGGGSIEMFRVSCTSSTACAAVGEFFKGSAYVPLAEKWNGTEWSLQEPPAPTGATYSNLISVSCTASIECTAVGYFVNGSEKHAPFAERWTGTAWSVQEPPIPIGAKETLLDGGVSCTSSTECTAVGSFVNSSGKEVSLAERMS